jgi:hypothetical protein
LREMMILQATGAREPGPRGEREGNRKTIAQGVPDRFGQPVVTMLVCFFHLHARPRAPAREAAGASCTRHSLRPLHEGRRFS